MKEDILLFAAFVFVQSSYGYPSESAPPEKFKLTAPHAPYFPDQKTESISYKHKSVPPNDDVAETKYGEDNKEQSTTKYDFYTPHKDFHTSDSTSDDFEDDSSYIPHSKKFSKYLKPSEKSSLDEKHTLWKEDESHHDENSKKSEDIPRYGYDSHNDHHSNHKNYESNEDSSKPLHHDEWIKKHPLPFKYEPKYVPHSNEEHKHHEHNDKKQEIHPSHHEERGNFDDKSHLRYQHWSDKGAEAFPIHNTEKLIEEISIGKSPPYDKSEKSLGSSIPFALHHAEHSTLHGEKASYVSPIEKLIKEHGIYDHQSPHKSDGRKSPHKQHKYIESHTKSPHLLKHYPHINKYQNEQHFKSFRYFKPQLNFGGHHYDWMYKPKSDFYKEMRKDLDVKIRLLKEHEDKLAQLQKGHLEKYQALFKPHSTMKFFSNKLSKHDIPNIGHKLHLHPDIHIPKFHVPKYEALHSLPKHSLGYNDYSKEPEHISGKTKHLSNYETPHLKDEDEHSSHKPQHHSHYENPHSKHEEDFDSHEPNHYSHHKIPHSKHEEEYSSHKPDHHSHYEIPHSKHEEEYSSHKPDHHSHYEIPHSKHEEEHSSYKPKHHSHYEIPHSKHEEEYSSHKPKYHSHHEIPHSNHEEEYSSHKPKHYSHYEIPHSEHEEEYKNHKPRHHSHSEIPHSKHEEEYSSQKPKHNSHYEIPHSEHEEEYSNPKPKHNLNYESPHSRYGEPQEESKHYHHEHHHYKDDYSS